jgi:hypothetical protein
VQAGLIFVKGFMTKFVKELGALLIAALTVLLVGCGSDDNSNNNNNGQAQQFAPITAAGVTDPNSIYTVNIAGVGPTTLRFPAAGQYQVIANGQTVNGTISNLQHTSANTWTATLTPDPNQVGATGGPLTLTWTGTNAGTFTLQPQGAAAQSGTFTVTGAPVNPGNGGGQTNTNQNPGVTNNPSGGTGLVGKTLQLNYQGGGGEKFAFTSATAVSYENGADTATYQYDTTTGQLNIIRSGGQTYRLIVAPGSSTGTTTVTYQEPGGNPTSDTASYTLQ